MEREKETQRDKWKINNSHEANMNMHILNNCLEADLLSWEEQPILKGLTIYQNSCTGKEIDVINGQMVPIGD